MTDTITYRKGRDLKAGDQLFCVLSYQTIESFINDPYLRSRRTVRFTDGRIGWIYNSQTYRIIAAN